MAYLEHFADTIGCFRAILADVGTEEKIGAFGLVALIIYLIVAKLLEDRLRHISVQVVDEYVL